MKTLRGNLFVSRAVSTMEVRMRRINGVVLIVLALSLIPLAGCQDLVIDKEKLFRPGEVPEIVGFWRDSGQRLRPCRTYLRCLGGSRARA
jgi:hypothetical protein